MEEREEREYKERSGLSFLVDTLLSVEKLRVAAQVRESHLELQGRTDPETEAVRDRLIAIEGEITGWVKRHMESHPAWPWLLRVKGCGLENTAKVVADIDIERADTISSLWAFAGFGVTNGHSPRRTQGEKLPFNIGLRTMCWRLGSGLLRAQGKFAEYYYQEKEKYYDRFEQEGRRIIPATQLPKVGGKKTETAEVISEGHVHLMALRKMLKLWLACLWLVWREQAGLSTRSPYAIEHLGHTHSINPWEMVEDR